MITLLSWAYLTHQKNKIYKYGTLIVAHQEEKACLLMRGFPLFYKIKKTVPFGTVFSLLLYLTPQLIKQYKYATYCGSNQEEKA